MKKIISSIKNRLELEHFQQVFSWKPCSTTFFVHQIRQDVPKNRQFSLYDSIKVTDFMKVKRAEFQELAMVIRIAQF